MQKLMYFILIAIMILIAISCTGNKKQKNKVNIDDELEQLSTKGAEWLKLIFTCADNENDFCFPDEESICSERYYAYYIEYMDIFEYPDFETEAEQKAAEKQFNDKWKDIYPVGDEIWSPFGRGNGMEIGQRLKNVSITHRKGLEYTVTVDYGDDLVFKNEVTLVPYDDVFQVDYIKTEFIE